MARPTGYPEWATLDQVDPTSGQNNKVEPPAAWKEYGWSYQEKPPRNYDNWFKNLAYQWLEYLDGTVSRAATYFVAASDASAESIAHADAVCDGTNDEVQIQAAITAVEALGGGLVVLSEGTFSVLAGITLATGVHLRGMGRVATVVQVGAAVATDFAVFTATSKSDLSISGLYIDGNKTGHAEDHTGVRLTTSARVAIFDMGAGAMSSDAGGPPAVYGHGVELDQSYSVVLDRCFFDAVEGYGVYVDADSYLNIIHACDFTTCTLAGIDVYGIQTAISGCNFHGCPWTAVFLRGAQNVIAACRVHDNDGNGIYLAAADNIVSGCHVTNNGYHGIALDGADYNVIKGNVIDSNSQDTNNTYDGISIDADSDSNLIEGNMVRKGAGANAQRYGIDCGSATNIVIGNYLLTGGSTANLNGSGRTIPQWIPVDDGTSPNQQNNIQLANIVA